MYKICIIYHIVNILLTAIIAIGNCTDCDSLILSDLENWSDNAIDNLFSREASAKS